MKQRASNAARRAATARLDLRVAAVTVAPVVRHVVRIAGDVTMRHQPRDLVKRCTLNVEGCADFALVNLPRQRAAIAFA